MLIKTICIGYEEGQKKREREGNKETTTKPSDSLLISGYNEGSKSVMKRLWWWIL